MNGVGIVIAGLCTQTDYVCSDFAYQTQMELSCLLVTVEHGRKKRPLDKDSIIMFIKYKWLPNQCEFYRVHAFVWI